MQWFCEPFAGKKITVLGLGVLGRGVGDAEFLADCGAEVTVSDKKSAEELQDSVGRLRDRANVSLHLGGHDTADFTSCDMVVKAAGVPLDSPEIHAAKAAGIPVAMSTALFAKYAMEKGARLIGVTGTRGKTTVANMIYHVLSESKDPATVHLGGNIRGISTLAMLPQVKEGDLVVLELDSWQLQGFGELGISPQVAVFTNLMLDHQNYYRNMDEYFADKANIYVHQKSGSLIIGQELTARIPHGIVPPALPGSWQLRLLGEHNRDNAAFAAQALRVLGLAEEDIQAGIESFEAVEGRLQNVGTLNETAIYNDNNATTPEATIAALRALGSDITLICGGSDKGLPLDDLAAEIQRRVSRIVLLRHQNYAGTVRLAAVLAERGATFEEATDLSSALQQALRGSPKVVLFSPAFASFGMFKNEYDRNDQFLSAVRMLRD